MRPLLFGVFITLLIAVGVALQPTEAQSEETCPAFVEQAVARVGDLCENLGRNIACYGHSDVETVLYPGVSVARFDEPADRIELTSLNRIHTAPLDEADQRWGIALLSAQANLPHTAPGQNVVMMLVGDASLENQVMLEEQITVVDMVRVNTLYDANLRDQPALTGTIIGSVLPDTPLTADMLSEDGLWVRIPQPEGDVMWVSRDVLVENPALDALPQPAPTKISAMQSFYFNAGIGQATCAEASGTLYIQGPNNIRVDLAINGVDISIGSTIAVSFTSATQMQVATLSGTGYVEGTTVPAGYAVTIDLDATHVGMVETISTPQRLDETGLSRYQLSEVIPESLLHYRIDLQPVTEVIENTTNPVNNVGGNVNLPIGGDVVNGNVTRPITGGGHPVVDGSNPVGGGVVQTGTNPNEGGLSVDVGLGGLEAGVDVGGDSLLNLNLNLDLDNDGEGGLNLNLNLFGW